VSEDVTPQLQAEADAIDVDAEDGVRRLKARRPVQNYTEMGIPVRSMLHFSNGVTACEVTSSRRVEFEGEDYSLTALTQRLLGTDRPTQPSPHWTYKGRRLSDIYNDTYESP